MKSYRWDFLDVPLLPVRRMLQVAGQLCLLWSKSPGLANGQNDSTGVHDLESSSSGFWSSRWCFGARVSFGTQSYVYIGPRVVFG